MIHIPYMYDVHVARQRIEERRWLQTMASSSTVAPAHEENEKDKQVPNEAPPPYSPGNYGKKFLHSFCVYENY